MADEAGSPGDVTRLLICWREGDPAAADRLFALLYPELRELARRQLRAGADAATLERVRRSESFGCLLKTFRPEELKASIEIAFIRHGQEAHLKRNGQSFAAAIKSTEDAVGSRVSPMRTPEASRIKYVIHEHRPAMHRFVY